VTGFGTGTGGTGTYSVSTTGTTSSGSISIGNGIAYVTAADLDGDHITDYVYAGDLLGNLWRFDLTSATESSWAASSTPLFSAPPGQPITTKVLVISVPQTSGPPRIMVDFGTGRKFPPTNLVPASYQPGIQYLYGIWDWNVSNWDGMSSTKYLSLTSGTGSALTPSNLQSQTLTPTGSVSAGTAGLDGSSNTVCWQGSSTCTSGNNQYGFAEALPGVQEQIVFNPLVFQNALIVNTTIPAVNSPSSCTVAHDTGDTIAISLVSGGSLGSGSRGFFLNTTDTNAAGSQSNGTGTPFITQAGGNTFILTQSLGDGSTGMAGGAGGTGGSPNCPPGTQICQYHIPQASLVSKRLTWIQRR
jgi:type IV pilus assembly protein PilY1